jgi:hypothetical protein
VFKYLPRNEPVYIVQAGTNLMTYADTDMAASLNDVYTTAAAKEGLDLFMLIHGIDMIKTTGDHSSSLLRGNEVTLKLSDKTNSGAEGCRLEVENPPLSSLLAVVARRSS